jgi:valyl-tRNA synthetase
MTLWQKLQELPREDWPQYIKKNHPELWLKFAWQKVNQWRDGQKNQAQILGDTPDYSRELFTLDERANKMVFHAFKKYWQDGLIYKGAYLVNWSIGLQTALSDVSGEIEYEKKVDSFVTFEYRPLRFDLPTLARKEHIPLVAKLHDYFDNNPLLVSTVRPETIFGDVAIAIHPDVLTKKLNQSGFSIDEIAEAKNFIKKGQIGIWFGIKSLGVKEVILILSDKVDPNFGSGTLKVTPASDMVDYGIYNENLDLIARDIPHPVNRQGKLTEICGEFAGLTTEEARPLIIKKLIETNYIPKKTEEILSHLESENDVFEIIPDEDFLKLNLQEKYKYLEAAHAEYEINWNYQHNVSICERTKTIIEPLISEEFFLSYKNKASSTAKTLAEHGLEGVDEVNFYSSDYKERAKNFLNNINDWCISRNLLWGHRIPVWYNLDLNPEKKFYNFSQLIENPELNKHFQIDQFRPEKYGNWIQEEKIFDTWFSSSLWPLSTLGFYDYEQKKQKLFIVHGGDSHKTEKDYLDFIKNWNLSPQDYLDIDSNWGSWKKNLQKNFNDSHVQVIYPSFPDKLNAKYEAWKIWFEKILIQTETNNLSLLGHSLGGNFLIKYLSENDLKIKNLYLIASCLNIGDFITNDDFSKISQNCENIKIYHSKDDKIVDFKIAKILKEKLPKAKLFEFENKGHFVEKDFVELKNQVEKDLKIEPTTDFEKFYPTQEMVTAKEIFYLWIVRMIVLGKYFTGQIPFQSLIITPTILDEKGKKMSKSLGNGLEPVEAINKFSSDSLRMAMLGGMIPNRNMKMGGRIADELMEKYRNFGNKVWNVARFLENKDSGSKITNNLSPASAWILNKFIELENSLEKNINNYELAHSIESLYKFLWDYFADWYVEYLKTDETQLGFANQLFEQFIILLSPYAPFETEVLWKDFFGKNELLANTIRQSNWSQNISNNVSQKDISEFEDLLNFIVSVRSLRGLFAIDPGTPITVHCTSLELQKYLKFVKLITKTEIENKENKSIYSVNSTKFNYSVDIKKYISDLEKEKQRTDRQIQVLEKQIQVLEKQLNNQAFIQRAEPEAVAQKQKDFEDRKLELKDQKTKLTFLEA